MSCGYHLYTDDLLWQNFLSPQCREHSLITILRLRMADPCTKFEVSSVIRCRDISQGVNLALTSPLSENIFHRQGWDLQWLTYVPKFKVPACRHYEGMNGGAKCKNWGSLGQLGVTPVHPQCHHSIERIFLFDFNRNHASILYCFQDIASYLSKFADFDPPHLHLVPP